MLVIYSHETGTMLHTWTHTTTCTHSHPSCTARIQAALGQLALFRCAGGLWGIHSHQPDVGRAQRSFYCCGKFSVRPK